MRKREQKHFIIFRIVVLTQLRLRQQKISIKIVKQILFLPKVIHSIAKLIKLCLNNLFYNKNGISNENQLLFPCVASIIKNRLNLLFLSIFIVLSFGRHRELNLLNPLLSTRWVQSQYCP